MGLLSALFGSKKGPLVKRARALVSASHLHAAGAFPELQGRFPVLSDVNFGHWTFILTIAGVFVAATRLANLSLGESREAKLMDIVSKHLDKWNRHGLLGFENCKGLFEREFDRLTAAGHEPRFIASDAVGLWIVWNVLDHPPQTSDECTLIRWTGVWVIEGFFDWWDT